MHTDTDVSREKVLLSAVSLVVFPCIPSWPHSLLLILQLKKPAGSSASKFYFIFGYTGRELAKIIYRIILY